jgi:hypothetical protein
MKELAFLRKYVARPSAAPACELCAGPLPSQHRHVVEVTARRIRCSCAACAVLFEDAGERRFRTAPVTVRAEPDFGALEQWSALGIPVGVAFCFYSSAERRWIAILPGPAGAVEAELEAARFAEVRRRSALARSLADDVEAIIVRAGVGLSPQAFAAPIDRCYALAGMLRQVWKGVDGGEEARRSLDRFFAELAVDSGLIRKAS